METAKFAFILHPLTIEDIFRKYSFMKKWPVRLVESAVRMLPPLIASQITGISSPYGSLEGIFVGVSLTSRQMQELPTEVTLKKIIAAGKKASRAGAKIVGLGAMTAVVGDAGITVARNLDIAVTTGNSYTVATALEGTQKAAAVMGIDLERAEVAILGATGSIGSVCARILARKVNYLTLIARNIPRMEKLAEEIFRDTGLAVKVTSNIKEAIKKADVVLAVSSAADSLIHPEDLKPGAVVCDVARPRDVSARVAQARDDVLVIEGGVVEVPGDVEFNFNFGFPPKTAYACMAETMVLALEKRFENFSLGREMTVCQVDEISALAAKHGFKLAGFRSFERALDNNAIEKIKEKARLKRLDLGITMREPDRRAR
ncbi:MAG TPA: shikimate dehydrogenase [Firmicutes bacterium]|jgi:fatty aldehyde-generating acyl-ACP reductase|nr:shikimate dehydrogenase [Bacillota bacterium]